LKTNVFKLKFLICLGMQSPPKHNSKALKIKAFEFTRFPEARLVLTTLRFAAPLSAV